MTNEEQIEVCKAIALACVWPQGGQVSTVILEDLDERLPMERSWRHIHDVHLKEALRKFKPR